MRPRFALLHGAAKERIKVIRGLGTSDGAARLTDGFLVHYGMIRAHQAIGKAPAEAAGLPPLSGFKGLEVTKAASAGK